LYAEDEDSQTPTADELKDWAANYGMTFPVTADAGWAVDGQYEQDGGIPTQVLLAPGDKVTVLDQEVSTDDIEKNLPN